MISLNYAVNSGCDLLDLLVDENSPTPEGRALFLQGMQRLSKDAKLVVKLGFSLSKQNGRGIKKIIGIMEKTHNVPVRRTKLLIAEIQALINDDENKFKTLNKNNKKTNYCDGIKNH
jgi:hypothetical protein